MAIVVTWNVAGPVRGVDLPAAAMAAPWNVAGRVRGVALQAAALAEQPADVIALQEIRLSSMAPWRDALRRLGFAHVVTSLDAHDPAARLAGDRRLGVLIAGREP